MQVEVSEEFAQELRTITTLNPKGRDLDYLADWFLRIGMGTVKSALQHNPQLTLGGLMRMSYHHGKH